MKAINPTTLLDANVRDMIIFNKPYMEGEYQGGVRGFEVERHVVELLILRRYIDPNASHQQGPYVWDMLEFTRHNPGKWYYVGYTASIKRECPETAIIGLRAGEPMSQAVRQNFKSRYGNADYYHDDKGTLYAAYS